MLLLVLVAGLWARSLWRIDEVAWSDDTGFRYEVSTTKGGVRLMRLEKWTDPAPPGLISIPRDATAEADWRASNRWWVTPGGGATHAGRVGFAAATGTIGGPMMTAYAYRAWTVPLWALCAALSVLPVARVGWWFARRRRHGAGQCAGCGYDLRASPERCPECGRARV